MRGLYNISVKHTHTHARTCTVYMSEMKQKNYQMRQWCAHMSNNLALMKDVDFPAAYNVALRPQGVFNSVRACQLCLDAMVQTEYLLVDATHN